jgi:hypothetical protein
MGALKSRVMGSVSFGLVERDERSVAMHVSPRRSRINNNNIICITVHTLYMQRQICWFAAGFERFDLISAHFQSVAI